MVRHRQDDEAELAAEAGKAEQGGESRERYRALSPAAERALAEAAARRAERDRQGDSPTEVGGRRGPDPARYGDWEVKGRAVDF